MRWKASLFFGCPTFSKHFCPNNSTHLSAVFSVWCSARPTFRQYGFISIFLWTVTVMTYLAVRMSLNSFLRECDAVTSPTWRFGPKTSCRRSAWHGTRLPIPSKPCAFKSSLRSAVRMTPVCLPQFILLWICVAYIKHRCQYARHRHARNAQRRCHVVHRKG